MQGMLMSAPRKRLLQPAVRRLSRASVKQGERGASAVEFAIVLSLLFLIIFGIIQFGIAFNRDNGIKAAAKEGARSASVGGTEAEISQRIRDTQSMFDPNDIQVKIDYSTDNGNNYSSPPLCDDATSNKCSADSSACAAAGIGSLVRVTATVPGTTGDGRYAIVIPFWGNAQITFIGDGVFRCENKS
jgi:Flp pilus assembly protein TadG